MSDATFLHACVRVFQTCQDGINQNKALTTRHKKERPLGGQLGGETVTY